LVLFPSIGPCFGSLTFPPALGAVVTATITQRLPHMKSFYKIAEKSPEQQFYGDMTMRAVIRESLTNCHTINFIMDSSNELS
jgi:hypothetical protein